VSDALKRNDFSYAAQKLKDNPNARVDVSDVSSAKLRRLEDFGAPNPRLNVSSRSVLISLLLTRLRRRRFR